MIHSKSWLNLKKSASRRSIPLTFNKNELDEWWSQQKEQCYYCGMNAQEYNELLNAVKRNKKNDLMLMKTFKIMMNSSKNFLTVDRVDSGKPYALDNIKKSCTICQSVKGFFLGKEDALNLCPKILSTIVERVNQ